MEVLKIIGRDVDVRDVDGDNGLRGKKVLPTAALLAAVASPPVLVAPAASATAALAAMHHAVAAAAKKTFRFLPPVDGGFKFCSFITWGNDPIFDYI